MEKSILLDAGEHGVKGCILLLENCRMEAISGLQNAHSGHDFPKASRGYPFLL